MTKRKNILKVEALNIYFPSESTSVHAVKNVSFNLEDNQILGIIGESGSGKSSLAKAICRLNLNSKTSGKVLYANYDRDLDLLSIQNSELQKIRGKRISYIFQDPFNSFNPSIKCGVQIKEVILLHQNVGKLEAQEQTVKILEELGLERIDKILDSFPYQVSGGQLQRLAIAMAIVNKPDIIIADEPSSSLDSISQKQIINLIIDLKEKYGLSIIFISHDVHLISAISDSILIMKNGEIVEEGNSKDLITSPKNEYSKLLIESSKINSSNQDHDSRESALLEVKNLNVTYSVGKSFFKNNTDVFHSVKDLSFNLNKSEFLGLIGTSGSGKSSIARSITQLIQSKSDEISLNGLNISEEKNKKYLRQNIQIIFQDPHSSFDPRVSIADSIKEAMLVNNIPFDGSFEEKLRGIFKQVSLDFNLAKRLPSQLSGGEKQRACIARALSLNPTLLICDEPLSALDASTRKDIIQVLNNLKISLSLTILLISHDLNLVKEICDRIIVLKDGQIIEEGSPQQIFSSPKKEYTKLLIDSSNYSILQ